VTTTTDTSINPGWRVPDCPPSAVHDQLVQWFEVQEGELVLHLGCLCQLVQMWPSGTLFPGVVGIRLLCEGQTRDTYVNSNAWTAVRRYVEG
jgi:hypothetical protein